MMKQFFLILSLTGLTACSIQGVAEDGSAATAPLVAQTQVAVSLTPSLEPVATTTPLPTPTMPPTPVAVPSVMASPTPPSVILRPNCPTLVDRSQTAVWPAGSILFNTGPAWKGFEWVGQVEQEGIWAISAGNLQPQLVYQQAKYPAISPDGTTLVTYSPDPDTGPVIKIYSMVSGESVEVVVPLSADGRQVPRRYPSWLPDGRIRHALQVEQLMGVGQTWEIYTIDPQTKRVEQATLHLNLPEYEFFEYDAERGWPSGFVSIDPSYQRVLYTAGDGGVGLKHEVRLLDLETGEMLWSGSARSLSETTPEWSSDGRTVLFRVGEPIPGTDFAWSRIVSLTRDGVEEELPPQPFPQAESYVANFSRSPNGRFIFYSLYSYGTGRLHGYVVDTLTWEVGDVCDPDHNLLGSLPYDKVEVDWLPEGQLVYRVLLEEDGEVAHSLRVLDIPSWTAQIILEAEQGYGVNVFGWTPVESFPISQSSEP